MIKGVVFDLDGTLVYLPIDYRTLYRKFEEIMKISMVENQPLTKIIAALDVDTREKIFEVWTEAELDALKNLEVNVSGMREYERFRGKPSVLVTMQGRIVVEKILDVLGLRFNAVITREDSLSRERQIRMAVEFLGLKPCEVLVFGDRDSDAVASRKVGCKFWRVEMNEGLV